MTERLADIHTHILPCVDDGARNKETAIQMLKAEAEEGTTLVVLTPHFISGRNRYKPDELQLIYENLLRDPEISSLGIKLFLGNELYYTPDLAAELKAGRARTLGNTNTVLVEFSTASSAKTIINGCRDIYNSGYSIILAHMERYPSIDSDSVLDALLDMDVSFQMNASYVKPLCMPVLNGTKRWHKRLLKDGIISYIASDAHDMNERRPSLSAKEIERAFPQYAADMLYGNAAKLLGIR